MNLPGIAVTTILSVIVFATARRWAALAVMAAVAYITLAQRIEVSGFHFTAIRIVLLAGFIRVLVRHEYRGFRFGRMDGVFVAYAFALIIIPSLRDGTSEQLVYRLGCAYDMLLPYWVFRALLTNSSEVEEFFGGMAILIIPMALEMIFETLTCQNLFGGFGGIGDLTIRNGRPRSQGAFLIGITAGTFGATLMPIFFGLWLKGRWRSASVVGIVSSIIITITSNSSAPLMAFLCGVTGWLFWPLRRQMKSVRWGIVFLLIGLQAVMKAPVYYLIARLSALTGGDGWHRSYLIDRAIHFFSDWWLMGTNDTSQWMPYVLTNGMADITNQYVAAAVVSGLAGLTLLVWLLKLSFQFLGLSLSQIREHSKDTEILSWSLGVALFAHLVTIFSVSYWDQIGIAWWAFLAIVSSFTSDLLQGEPDEKTPESTQEPSADRSRVVSDEPTELALY